MKLSIETVFNDAGESHEAPLNRVFLGQRKWVVLCGAIVFLISNGYVALNQEWLLLSLNIHSGSIRLLSAVSFTCLLFGLYMFFGSYAFFKKHVIEQRIRFANLEIEERDIYSTRISELSQQVANVNVELSSKMEAKIKLIDQIATSRETYSELLELARLQEAGWSASRKVVRYLS